ncbi:hypothetical protein AMTR_s00352p00012360 [Amborella trichopoda]|uniref:Uncharacterized protein n=1 Tax=Amborella trichopoda TaxID=13333 RepID=W1P1T9_AMBTC|nr:hypothetical protein AMTR_s00352p00012360 [Amborella trichopoda]
MNDNDDIPTTGEGNVVEAAEDMEEGDDDFNEGNNKDDNGDDGIMRDDWRESKVVECEVPKVLGSPLRKKRDLDWFRKRSKEPGIAAIPLDRNTHVAGIVG